MVLIGEIGDASGVGAVNERDGGIKWDEDDGTGIVLILGGGGEGVRVRSRDFDCPRPFAGPAAVSEKALSVDIAGMLRSPLFPALTRFDPVVLSSDAVPEELCVSVGKSA